MTPTRKRTLRLEAALADDLDLVARIENLSSNEATCDAVRRYIDEKRKDAAFRSRVKRQADKEHDALERLSTPP